MRIAAARWGRLAGPLAAVALLAASLAAPVSAESMTGKQATPVVTTSVTTPAAGILRPGADLALMVTVSNATTSQLAAGTATVSITESALQTRDAVNGWLHPAAGANEETGRTLIEVPTPEVRPGQTVAVPATVPAASIGLAADDAGQVRGIADRFVAPKPAGAAAAAAVTAEGRSTLVWSPETATPTPGVVPTATPALTNVSVVMPLTSGTTSGGILTASELATFTGPGGLLTRQLEGIAHAPTVAVGIDPMVIASIRALGSAAPPSATAWLAQLEVIPNETFALSYGDADVAAQAQSGVKALLGPTSLAYALDPANFQGTAGTVGETDVPSASVPATPTPGPTTSPTPAPHPLPTLAELLSWPYTLPGIAWPADNTVRTADLPVFAASGITTTILSSDNVTMAGGAGGKTTPDIVASVTGGTALVADSTISKALRAAVTATSDQAWNGAMAEVAAQLTLVGQEKPASAHSILLTLDRNWPSTAQRLAETLSALATLPGVAPATLSQAKASPASSELTIKDSPEDGARIHAIRSLITREQSVAAFATVTADPTILIGEQRAKLLSLLAVGWQNPIYDWDTAVTTSLNASQKTVTSVQIVTRTDVNVVGTTASIPITISNQFDQPVTVVLHVTPSNGRLEIGADVTKMVQANSRAAALVPVNARLGNGKVILNLELLSPTGVPIGGHPTVPVNVRADWEGLAALIIGILVVLFFGWGIVRSVLRRRRAGEHEESRG